MKNKTNNLNVLKPDFFNDFIDNLKSRDSKKLFKKIKDSHPSEVAAYLQVLNEDHRTRLIKFLELSTPDTSSDVFLDNLNPFCLLSGNVIF